MRVLLVLLTCLVLVMVSCQSGIVEQSATLPIGKPYNPAKAPRVHTRDDRVIYASNGTEISLKKPKHWEIHSTEYGVLIAEKMGSVATRGQLEGLLAFVSVTPLEAENYRINHGSARAVFVLDEMIASQEHLGEVQASNAYTFAWGEQEAAYYLLREPEQNTITLMVGILSADQSVLLTAAISAPQGQAQRIRDMLPVVLGELTLNGTTYPREPLDALPNPLPFP